MIELPDFYSHTHKVRVVGDLMFTNVEQNDRHFLRISDQLENTRIRLNETLGRQPTDTELADGLGIDSKRLPELEAVLKRGYENGGFKIYDISDKYSPKLLSHTKTYGFGVHRFDVDEDYAYMSTEMEGYVGNILVNYDISNPIKPEEVSRWWMEGQHLAGGETPTWSGYTNRPASCHAGRQRNVGSSVARRVSRHRCDQYFKPQNHRFVQLPPPVS